MEDDTFFELKKMSDGGFVIKTSDPEGEVVFERALIDPDEALVLFKHFLGVKAPAPQTQTQEPVEPKGEGWIKWTPGPSPVAHLDNMDIVDVWFGYDNGYIHYDDGNWEDEWEHTPLDNKMHITHIFPHEGYHLIDGKIQPLEKIDETEHRFKEGDRVWHSEHGHGVFDDWVAGGAIRYNVNGDFYDSDSGELIRIPEGWTTHDSGECPVKGTNLVEALLTSGKKEASEAEYLPWYHIIAYKDYTHEEDTPNDTDEPESSAEEAEEVSDTQEEASDESPDVGNVGEPEPKFAVGDMVKVTNPIMALVGKTGVVDDAVSYRITFRYKVSFGEIGNSLFLESDLELIEPAQATDHAAAVVKALESEPTTEPVTPAEVHHQTEQGG